MDTQIIIDYLSKNKEWVLSGVGVALISAVTGVVISVVVVLIKWFGDRKTLISTFQKGNSIYLHNGGNRTVDVHLVSFTLKDISCSKDLTRPPALPIYSRLERPIDSRENAKVADLGEVFSKTIAEYTSDDREAFSLQYPGWGGFPVMLGLDITVDFSILGSRHVRRTIIERMLSGYAQRGFIIAKKPYGRDSTVPTRIRLKEKLFRILGHARRPIEWYHQRKRNRLVQAKVTAECIFKALHYKVIGQEEAAVRINAIREALDSDGRDALDQYLRGRMIFSA